jgi:hypothetical protein
LTVRIFTKIHQHFTNKILHHSPVRPCSGPRKNPNSFREKSSRQKLYPDAIERPESSGPG